MLSNSGSLDFSDTGSLFSTDSNKNNPTTQINNKIIKKSSFSNSNPPSQEVISLSVIEPASTEGLPSPKTDPESVSNCSDYYSNWFEIGEPKVLQNRNRLFLSNTIIDPNRSIVNDEYHDEHLFVDSQFFRKNVKDYVLGGLMCEFCRKQTLPWPASRKDSNNFYCCSDYKDFVKSIMDYNGYMEAVNQRIYNDFRFFNNIEKAKSSSDKQLIKKIEELKKLEKMLRNNETFIKRDIVKVDKLKNFTSEEKERTVDTIKENTRVKETKEIKEIIEDEEKNKKENISLPGKRTAESTEESEEDKIRNKISYILSNHKYVEKGWTCLINENKLIDISANLQYKYELDDYLARNQNHLTSSIQIFPFELNKIILKNFTNDRLFQVMLTDSTGNVFYPSGRLAIAIINTKDYKVFLAFSDTDSSIILASFDSNGNCYCNYDDGKLRFQINCRGGINFDPSGNCIRRWLWPDDEKINVFHPIVFSLNESMGVQIHNRSKIIFTIRTKYGSARFLVGSKVDKIFHKKYYSNHFKSTMSDETCISLKKRADLLLKTIQNMSIKPTNDLINKANQNNNSLKLPVLSKSSIYNTNHSSKCSKSTFKYENYIINDKDKSVLNNSSKSNSINFSLLK